MKPNLLSLIPAIEGEELVYIQALTKELSDEQLMNFVAVYNGKRKKTDQILLGCILGFLGIAGVQRFMVKQSGMGILYFFTLGLCFIGTIVDIINHKRIASDFNRDMAIESMAILHTYNRY